MRRLVAKILVSVIVLVVAGAYLNSQGYLEDLTIEAGPPNADTDAQVDTPLQVNAAHAREQLASVETAPAVPVDYEREEQFGSSWLDTDDNGCDTRNDILTRDLTEVVVASDGCTVESGVLADPYTSAVIDFIRGSGTSNDVQIDHIVPLSLAARSGAMDWPQDRREAFANNPANLLASDGPTNGSKGDQGPGEWLPPNEAFECEYVAAFVHVVAEYDLTMTEEDAAAAENVLATC